MLLSLCWNRDVCRNRYRSEISERLYASIGTNLWFDLSNEQTRPGIQSWVLLASATHPILVARRVACLKCPLVIVSLNSVQRYRCLLFGRVEHG